MKNTRENFTHKEDVSHKNIHFSRFFKVKYSEKYKSEVLVFDPSALFSYREKFLVFKHK